MDKETVVYITMEIFSVMKEGWSDVIYRKMDTTGAITE